MSNAYHVKLKHNIIILDLDGTLTNNEKEITTLTQQMLLKVQKDGAKIILASGRPTYGIQPVASCLKLGTNGGYILSYNGGKIIDCSTNNEIYSTHLPSEVLPILYEYSKTNKYALLGYNEDKIITEFPNDRYVKEESRINKMEIKEVDNLLNFVEKKPTKLLMTGHPTDMISAEKDLKERLGNKMDIYRSAPFFIELVPKGIDKAQSILRLLNKLGQDTKDVIAFGDGYNDISMLKLADIGVAMANAPQEVKANANVTTISNEDDGVAIGIAKYCY